jgi:hypothetical protein
MVQAVQISENTNLYDLRVNFGLRPTDDDRFFVEWRQNLPKISSFEISLLDRVKHNFESMSERSHLSENLVKMAIVSPLLDLAGFYSINYLIRDEASIEITVEGEDETIYRGRIDLLVVQDQFWVIIIEAKKIEFSLEKALPQALAYMLANPHPDQPVFGLLTNGSEFRFLKVIHSPSPCYGVSKIFSIRDPGNELYDVLKILKKIATQIRC